MTSNTTVGRPLRRAILPTVLALSGCWVTACSSGPSSVQPAASATLNSLPTPVATSLETPTGTWATVAMGHLDDPLNTFWQLFFEPSGSSAWTNHVEATATGTNGGLVLASASGGPLVVGVRPSNGLKFTPLISTSDAGNTWSDGLLNSAIAARPDALAANAKGQNLAIVNGPGGTQVMESTSGISSWQVLTTKDDLASASPDRACQLRSLTAVSYLSGAPLIGGSCAGSGVVGIFASSDGDWRPAGPPLPSSMARGRVDVLALQSGTDGVSALLEIADAKSTSLVAAWNDGVDPWVTSPPFRLATSETVTSFGPAVGSGLFVLAATPSGSERLAVVSGPGSDWHQSTPPPSRTATVAYAGGTIEALSVDTAVMTVWTLDSVSQLWVQGQVVHVPIPFGSAT